MMLIRNVVVVYDYAFINGGAAKVAIQSAVALSKMKGIKVFYFAAVGPVCSELKNSDVQVVCLNDYDINDCPSRIRAAMFGVWNVKAAREFKKLLEGLNSKNTVIHFHGWVKALSTSVIKTAYDKNFKIIITLHEYFTACPNGGFYNYRSNIICDKVPMSIKCIICNCDKRHYIHKLWRCCRQFVQDYILRNMRQISYIYISDFSYSILKPFLGSQNTFYVHDLVDIYENVSVKAWENSYYICVCRISAEKGVDLFCEAMEVLGLNGIVIGDGDLKEVLRKRYKSVNFIGWKEKDEILQYVLGARAIVFPSKWYETAGLVVLEMLGCGLPCVVPDRCSASEYICDNVNGVVFSSGNKEDLINKILLLEDDKFVLKLSSNIKRSFDSKIYDENTHVVKLMQVYDFVLTKQ